MRESYALIDLNNLKQNYFNIRKKVKPAKILAVVKADAYGHGAVEVSKFLSELNPKPEYYGVALFDEAIQLRNSGIKEPILVFDVINSEKLSIAQEYSLDITISRNIDYEFLKKFFSKNKAYLNAHIKINTGMNRLGIRWYDNLNEISKFYKIERLKINGIYTHFATSDIPKDKFAKTQLERFNKIIDKLKSLNIDLGIIHSANSGAILNMPESFFDMVRPGISLYGYKPDLNSADSIYLKPVMSIISNVANVISIKKGESVSYGRRFISKTDSQIISVPFGYADGYPRALTNKSKAIIKNKFYNQVGTVTMDRIMFDIGNDKISVGDKVILLGKNKNLKIDAWDWSKILNTIPYEITCNISKRVPRIYKF